MQYVQIRPNNNLNATLNGYSMKAIQYKWIALCEILLKKCHAEGMMREIMTFYWLCTKYEDRFWVKILYFFHQKLIIYPTIRNFYCSINPNCILVLWEFNILPVDCGLKLDTGGAKNILGETFLLEWIHISRAGCPLMWLRTDLHSHCYKSVISVTNHLIE